MCRNELAIDHRIFCAVLVARRKAWTGIPTLISRMLVDYKPVDVEIGDDNIDGCVFELRSESESEWIGSSHFFPFPLPISNTNPCIIIIYLHIYKLIYDPHNDLLPVDRTAQLVEHCTGIAGVTAPIPVHSKIFQAFLAAT